MLQANKRDFQRHNKKYLDSQDITEVSDNGKNAVGYFVPLHWYLALTSGKQVSDNSHFEVSDIPFEVSDNSDSEELPACDKCGQIAELRKTWEDGEEYRICFDCVVFQYGKPAPKVWRKLSKL